MKEYDSLTQSASGNTELANIKVMPGSAPWTDKLRERPGGSNFSARPKIVDQQGRQIASQHLEGMWIGF